MEGDGVHVVAAACEGSGGEVRIVSHTEGQDGLVCRANGCEIRGIELEHSSCAPGSGCLPSSDNVPSTPADSMGCIRVECGDLRVIQCSISSWSGFGVKVSPMPAHTCCLPSPAQEYCARMRVCRRRCLCLTSWCALPLGRSKYQVVGNSNPHIESCTMAHCREVAVLLMDNSSATLRSCRLSRNKCAGIVLLDSAAGDLHGNTIAHNEKCGIVCAGRSSASVVGNAVLGVNGGGVWIRESSLVSVRGNLIALSLKVSLQVSDDSTPTVEDNRISNGCNGGIVVHGRARGSFRNNLITGHNKAGLGVTDAARPRFEGNTFVNNRAGGAIFTGNSRSEWYNNVCQGNLLFGMHIRGNASIDAGGGACVANAGPGMQLQESGHALVQQASFHGNQRAGVIAVGNANVKLAQCVVSSEPPHTAGAQAAASGQPPEPSAGHLPFFSRQEQAAPAAADPADAGRDAGKTQKIGLQVAADARMELVSCRVEGHASGNIVVQGRSTCRMHDTVVANAPWAGIVLQGTSRTELSRVCVRDARSAGVLCMDQAVLEAENSEFVDCKGIGLLMAGSSDSRLVRNAISANSGTGLMIKESANVNMYSNRISNNGVHGVSLEGSCFVAASENAVFENEGAGIHATGVGWAPCSSSGGVVGMASAGSGIPELVAVANILVSGAGSRSLAAVLDGPLTGVLHGNILDTWQTIALNEAQQEADHEADTALGDYAAQTAQVGDEQREVASPHVAGSVGGSNESGVAAGGGNESGVAAGGGDESGVAAGGGDESGVAASATETPADSHDAADASVRTAPGESRHENVASRGADSTSELALGNVVLPRCEVVSLLRDELVPSNGYGPLPEHDVRGAMRMLDGSLALLVTTKGEGGGR